MLSRRQRGMVLRLPQLPKNDPNQPDVFEEMTLQEHLIELRDRIFKIVAGVVAGFILGMMLVPAVLQSINEAANLDAGLDVLSPADPIVIYFRIALYIAIGVTLPNITYQIIAFLASGLTRREKRIVFSSIPFMLLLFANGVAYGYLFAIPRALDFLSGFLRDYINFNIDAVETVSFYVALLLGLVAIRLYLLYEVGIVISRLFARTSLGSPSTSSSRPRSSPAAAGSPRRSSSRRDQPAVTGSLGSPATTRAG